MGLITHTHTHHTINQIWASQVYSHGTMVMFVTANIENATIAQMGI